MRILWVSDAPWAPSGYGVISGQTAPRLKELGHDVAMLTTFGLHGNSIEWKGLKVYPGGADPFANDVVKQAALDWRADIVITLKDLFVFKPDKFDGLRWVPLVPVDHDPIPPSVVEIARRVYRPIAYALDGYAQMHDVGLDPLYAPHTYDPTIFSPQDRSEARRFLGLPDDIFIIGTVAVNRGGIPSRKAWPQNLEAFARIARKYPNLYYFLHTNVCEDGFEGGVNIRALATQLGVLDRLLLCEQDKYKAGFPDGYMNAYYNAIDVLNAVSLGEGFGIPTLEAQATGTPVIVSDWCASAELCFGGWKVTKDETLKFYDNQGTYVYIPQPHAIADRMERAYQLWSQDKVRWDKMKRRCIRKAKTYQIDTVIQTHWKPLLETLEAQIKNETSRGVLRIIKPQEVLL